MNMARPDMSRERIMRSNWRGAVTENGWQVAKMGI
jgi:hypothetical protein